MRLQLSGLATALAERFAVATALVKVYFLLEGASGPCWVTGTGTSLEPRMPKRRRMRLKAVMCWTCNCD